MGRRSGGGGSPTVVQQAAQPWANQIGPLNQLFDQAHQLHFNPQNHRKFFPGQTYAPFQPQELEALELGEARARAGSPSLNMVREYATGILSGDPKALRSTLGPRVGELLPGLQSQFNRAGMGASSLARAAEQELVARELSRLRESAADRLERLSAREYEDIARLAGVGEVRRDMEQQAIDEAMARQQFEQEEPYQRLRDYQNFITGNYGGQSSSNSTTFPMRGSRASGLFGGALGGAGLGAMTGLNPVVGGILGALGGLF